MDLTDQKVVVKYMAESTSEAEWGSRCDEVKAANGGDYPSWWFSAIVMSNLAEKTANKWGGSAQIRVTTL